MQYHMYAECGSDVRRTSLTTAEERGRATPKRLACIRLAPWTLSNPMKIYMSALKCNAKPMRLHLDSLVREEA